MAMKVSWDIDSERVTLDFETTELAIEVAAKGHVSLVLDFNDADDLREKLTAALVPPYPRDEWEEEEGTVLWWRFPVDEPPWVGSPLDDDWKEGYYTHYTFLPEVTP